MNYILFDDSQIREELKPFTFIRPISDIRVGILTIREKWEKHLQQKLSYLTPPYLQKKFPVQLQEESILINGALFPHPDLLQAIQALQTGQLLKQGDWLIAAKIQEDALTFPLDTSLFGESLEFPSEVIGLKNVTDIFVYNGAQIQADFTLLTQGRTSQPFPDPHTIVYNPDNVFIEEGVKMKAAVLNAENGFIYLGKDAAISEGTIIQGNFALCEGAVIKPGGKMRGDTTIGPYSKVGGEISNSVIFGNSNKGHEGFLGNSVLGEWCNLGADTNTSNMKNNYGSIKIWNYPKRCLTDTGRQFCGLIMGDHSKTGINTMFNTGTVVGINVNIYGGGFPPKFIPSFSWGGDEFVTFQLHKAYEVAERMMSRRNETLSEEDKAILQEIYERRSLFYNNQELDAC